MSVWPGLLISHKKPEIWVSKGNILNFRSWHLVWSYFRFFRLALREPDRTRLQTSGVRRWPQTHLD